MEFQASCKDNLTFKNYYFHVRVFLWLFILHVRSWSWTSEEDYQIVWKFMWWRLVANWLGCWERSNWSVEKALVLRHRSKSSPHSSFKCYPGIEILSFLFCDQYLTWPFEHYGWATTNGCELFRFTHCFPSVFDFLKVSIMLVLCHLWVEKNNPDFSLLWFSQSYVR